jgi:hypothetical protein
MAAGSRPCRSQAPTTTRPPVANATAHPPVPLVQQLWSLFAQSDRAAGRRISQTGNHRRLSRHSYRAGSTDEPRAVPPQIGNSRDVPLAVRPYSLFNNGRGSRTATKSATTTPLCRTDRPMTRRSGSPQTLRPRHPDRSGRTTKTGQNSTPGNPRRSSASGKGQPTTRKAPSPVRAENPIPSRHSEECAVPPAARSLPSRQRSAVSGQPSAVRRDRQAGRRTEEDRRIVF